MTTFPWSFIGQPVAGWWAGPGPADESHNSPHNTLPVPAAPYWLLPLLNEALHLIRVKSKIPYDVTPWHIPANLNWAAFDL